MPNKKRDTELRNPLAPLRNAAQVLNSRGAGQADIEHARGMLDRNIATMSRMIEDLLDASRVTQGRIQLRLETIEMAVVLARAVSSVRPDIDAHDQKVEISLPSVPIYVNADPTRLEQVFANLLNNASKFGHRGGHIWLSMGAPSEGEVVVRVRDDGIGIPAEALRSVFDLFTQVDNSLDRTQTGLGIGLTLVRNLLELHRGKVEAHSAGPGKGSEFIVRLPVIPSEMAETRRSGLAVQADDGGGPEAAGPISKRILVVDDNVDSAESLATLLRIRGNEVKTAADGPSALKLAATFQPEVVLLDVGLPGMDGYEVARKLRQQPSTSRALLIALTGYGRVEDREAALKAGFDKHFTKPIEAKALYQYVAQVSS
jgi:CheY-like chemotaxis protein